MFINVIVGVYHCKCGFEDRTILVLTENNLLSTSSLTRLPPCYFKVFKSGKRLRVVCSFDKILV